MRNPALPRRRHRRAATAMVAALGAMLCLGTSAAATTASATAVTAHQAPFTLRSHDFRDGGHLPAWTEFGGAYADEVGCNGRNLAPELDWHHAPAGTQSFALLVNDVDAPLAGGFHHWVVYDIPGSTDRLQGHGTLEYTQGSTSWNIFGIPVTGWGGPCPPPTGQTHHYVFTLYALSLPSVPGEALSYEQLTSAIHGHTLGAASIISTFALPLRS